ncbi:MAG: hypothetical protein ACPGYS_04315 [Flavobacteriales bacterium]
MNGLALPTCILCDQEVHIHHLPDGRTWFKGHRARPLNGRVCDACHGLILGIRFGDPTLCLMAQDPDLTDLRIYGKAERESYDKIHGDAQ